jgi:hypothetical protein
MEKPNYNQRGNLYKNDRKRADKKDPDYTGIATVGDVEYYMDAWINKNDAGVTYMGIKFKEKTPKIVETVAVKEELPFDDEIPF